MTVDLTSAPQPRQSLLAMAIEATLGAITGAAAIWLYLSNASVFRWADGIALMIVVVCLIGATRLWMESYDPIALARRMGVEGDVTEREKRDVRWQALISAAFGLAVFWPPLATLSGTPAPVWSYLVIAAFLGLQLWYGWRASKSADEYAKAHTRHLTVGGLMASQTALLAYATAERLGVAPTVTAWDVFVVFVAISTIVPLFSLRSKVRA